MNCRLFYVASLLLLSLAGIAQTNTRRDSLLPALKNAKEDSNKVRLLITIGNAYEEEDNDYATASTYYLQAGLLSKKINDKPGFVKYVSNHSQLLNIFGKLDSAKLLNSQAVEMAKTLNDRLALAKAYTNLGNSYNYLNDLDSAVIEYQKGLQLFEELNESLFVARVQDLFQLLFTKLEQYQKGISYGTAAVDYFRKADKKLELAMALLNLANNYAYNKQETEALKCYKEANKIFKESHFKRGELTCVLGIGDYYFARYDAEEMRPFYESGLQLSTEIGDVEGMAISNRGLALYYLMTKQFSNALNHINQSLAIAQNGGLKKEIVSSMKAKSSILYALQDVLNAGKYLDSADMIQKVLFGNETQNKVLSLEKRYETQKKETQIILQQAQIKQKSTLIYFLIVCAVAILALSLLGLRNHKNKQKLQQVKIDELEKEKQLTAVEAVLKGEEQERTRLAKDLHDGLGGMLSGIKYSLNNMKDNLIMTPDNAQAFERSIDMLDSSIKEMRRVAHNMMPEVLVKYGLNTALKEFCTDIDRSGVVHLIYQSMGLDNTAFDQTLAVTVYRIVQELVNNAIKHAAAKNVLVQVHRSQQEQLLAITVEDDGKGFDTSVLQSAKGIGWSNIRSRVDFLKGIIDINSEIDKGTSVLVEIKL